jgi:hypothetical protein
MGRYYSVSSFRGEGDSQGEEDDEHVKEIIRDGTTTKSWGEEILHYDSSPRQKTPCLLSFTSLVAFFCRYHPGEAFPEREIAVNVLCIFLLDITSLYMQPCTSGTTHTLAELDRMENHATSRSSSCRAS